MQDPARISEEQNTQRRARLLNIAYEDSSAREISLFPDILSVQEMYDLRVVPISADQYNIKFGITNTTSQSTMSSLQSRFLDQRVGFSLISDTGYKDFMRRYDPPKQIVYEDISLTTDQDSQISSVSKTLGEVRADDMLAYLVQQAYSLKASDIHLETDESSVRIRFRVDGVLHPIAELSPEKYRQLVSSLAVAANISTSSPDAQTGHINKKFLMADGSEVAVNMRVETVPTVHAMDAVLRLFNLKPEMMRLDSLGLNQEESDIIRDIISHPSGLVLLVGPTGSGKTTTLYSILNELNHPERKIITLEDPVEYQLKGITQIPVDSRSENGGFAEKFRAVLRLDPDVIMVGEIRDQDTAKTALQSSLTGHLVLSTYHASSAAAALTRLLDSIGDNPLFSSAIRLVAAQRLIRKLDDTTKQAYSPDDGTLRWIKSILDTLPPHFERPNIDSLQLYKPGKSAENPFGYKGQIAVRELLLMTDSLQLELKKPPLEITTTSLEHTAVQDGMVTMLQDAVLKALAGETSIEEVARVVA
jgi:type II secretory ATPase GspE/PulE/Tfp pilus assembly ATPase PilB-like protein